MRVQRCCNVGGRTDQAWKKYTIREKGMKRREHRAGALFPRGNKIIAWSTYSTFEAFADLANRQKPHLMDRAECEEQDSVRARFVNVRVPVWGMIMDWTDWIPWLFVLSLFVLLIGYTDYSYCLYRTFVWFLDVRFFLSFWCFWWWTEYESTVERNDYKMVSAHTSWVRFGSNKKILGLVVWNSFQDRNHHSRSFQGIMIGTTLFWSDLAGIELSP